MNPLPGGPHDRPLAPLFPNKEKDQTMFRNSPRKPARAAFKPQVENLEERRVMSANIVGGNIVIKQSALNDTAVVTQVQGPLHLSFFKVEETIGGHTQTPRSFFAPLVTGRIVYFG